MAEPPQQQLVTPDPWNALRNATAARIALGRAGGSLPTHEWLDFKASHAAARDAVHHAFDANCLARQVVVLESHTVIVDSAAGDRRTYLERPDLGRRLSDASRAELSSVRPNVACDLSIAVSDGLSAIAVERHAFPVLKRLLPLLHVADHWRIAPIVIARFGRVAIQDEIGELLGAELSLILLGERPGLGSPDSLGAYIVHTPRVGNTDANRNCVSNIRPNGLTYEAAADTIFYLLTEARRRKISGVQLKDERALPQLSKVTTQRQTISFRDT